MKHSVKFYYAGWNKESSAVMKIISKMEKEFVNIAFSYHELTDQTREDFKSNGIQFIPTVVILKEDSEIKRVEGKFLTSPLRSYLSNLK